MNPFDIWALQYLTSIQALHVLRVTPPATATLGASIGHHRRSFILMKNKAGRALWGLPSIEKVTGNNSIASSYDVTFTLSGDEATLSRKDLLLAIWQNDESYLQTKILLNLSRCLLKLADIDSYLSQTSTTTTTTKSNRHHKFRQAAVLGCSIAISICELSQNSVEDSVASLSL